MFQFFHFCPHLDIIGVYILNYIIQSPRAFSSLRRHFLSKGKNLIQWWRFLLLLKLPMTRAQTLCYRAESLLARVLHIRGKTAVKQSIGRGFESLYQPHFLNVLVCPSVHSHISIAKKFFIPGNGKFSLKKVPFTSLLKKNDLFIFVFSKYGNKSCFPKKAKKSFKYFFPKKIN